MRDRDEEEPRAMAWDERPGRLATSLLPLGTAAPAEDRVTAPAHRWPELVVDVAAVAPQLVELRAEARRWMETVEVPTDLARDVLIALSEAATNVVLHAYPPGAPGRMRVLGRRHGDELELAVEDEGTWRDRSDQHDGRGLAIIRAVSAGADVVPGTTGSRVAFRCTLPVAGRAAAAADAGAAVAGAACVDPAGEGAQAGESPAGS